MASPNLETKVLRIRPTPLLTPLGEVERRTTVEYMVGEHGPFSFTLPDAEFTAARVKTEMDKKAAEIRQLYPAR